MSFVFGTQQQAHLLLLLTGTVLINSLHQSVIYLFWKELGNFQQLFVVVFSKWFSNRCK